MANIEQKKEGVLAIREMAMHYHRLGKGKPETHEFNLKAEGLRFFFNAMIQTRRTLDIPAMTSFDE